MGYNEKELQAKLQEEKQQNVVLPTKKDTVGSLLRERREELKLSIERISGDLRIKPQYLSALEDNRFNSLPGSAYVIGFIKSYASYLKLDVQNIISLYKQETSNVIRENSDLIEDENSLIKDPIINSNHIIIGSLIVFLGILSVYMINLSKNSAQNIDDTEIVDALPIDSDTSKDNLEISIDGNISSETADETLQQSVENTDDIAVSTDISKKSLPDYFETKIDSVNIENNASDEFIPAENSEAKMTLATNIASHTDKISSQTLTSSIPEAVSETVATSTNAREYGLANKSSSRISVKATKQVWIKLKKDGFYKYDPDNGDIGSGETVFETILAPGDIYYVPNGDSFYLTIGNAQGVDIIVDGKTIEPLSPKEISRHNIEMNVEKLLNNTAYIRNRKVD